MTGVPITTSTSCKRLPPYVLAEVIDLMKSARRAGEDIIDLGMGNPDLPTPPHVVEKICRGGAQPAQPPLLGVARHPEPARRDLRVVPAPPRRRRSIPTARRSR